MTTLGIVLPFYGRADYLREAVDSVLGQDDSRWSLIVLDDAYPDPDAAAWVAELPDPRVHYVRNETNLGVSGSFQKSLTLASADWVVFMGGDDRMLPHFVSRTLEAIAAHPGASYIQPAVRVIDADGQPCTPMADRIKNRIRIHVDVPTVVEAQAMTESLLRGNWAYFPATAWRREAIARLGFEPRYEVVLDWLLQLQLLQEGGEVLLDPAVTFEYRRHPEQVSNGTALDVTRFHEEKALMLGMRDLTGRRGWRRAQRNAAWHLTSRLHAAQTMLGLWRSGRRHGTRLLLAHILTNAWPPGDWPRPAGPRPRRRR